MDFCILELRLGEWILGWFWLFSLGRGCGLELVRVGFCDWVVMYVGVYVGNSSSFRKVIKWFVFEYSRKKFYGI